MWDRRPFASRHSTWSYFSADIGSVKSARLGWAGRRPGSVSEQGTEIRDLVAWVAAALAEERPVALGFECPLFVPVSEDPLDFSSARPGEGSRPWSAQAGAAVPAIGVSQPSAAARRRGKPSVFDRLRPTAYSLFDCVAACVPADRGRLPSCRCKDEPCRHVRTQRHHGKSDGFPWDNDYIFASEELRSKLVGCAPEDNEAGWRWSSHCPVVAEFDL